ncbi:hypothetical protein BS78_09G117300 [Paspalum vaginatum]|nr:hypothetical protein BS78_09G117300 [Paspalum vaginatum]
MVLKFRGLKRCFIGSERVPSLPAPVPVLVLAPAPAPARAAVPPVSLPDNDDLLREILLRLPPLPSSLPRAALVCRRWRGLVSDPIFLSRFRSHHRTPPVLGYFFSDPRGPVFTPTLAPPDRIPPARFSLPPPPQEQPAGGGDRLFFLGCRHGLALLINRRRLETVVWDPVTGRQATVPYPPEFTADNGAHCCRGAVLSGGGADGGDDGDGRSMRPFRVILIRTRRNDCGMTVCMCVYESATAKWGETISTVVTSQVSDLPSVLIGNTLCGFFHWPLGILELDLERHSLAAVETPAESRLHCIDSSSFRVVRTQQHGELGLVILSERSSSLQLWARKKEKATSSSDHDVVLRWVLQRTVELDKLLFSPPRTYTMMDSGFSARKPRILGFDEDSNQIHISVSTCAGAFAIQLETMQFTKLFNAVSPTGSYVSGHPYASFYTAGTQCLARL